MYSAASTSSTVSSSSTAGNTAKEVSQQEALMQLMAPDGYYKYLGVEKKLVVENASGSSSSIGASATTTQPTYTVDEDAVKKAYRKLSRKHHPDKGGDVNTFRLLNRAQRVLLHSKLRAQYDNLGIDLDDEEEDDGNNATVDDNATDKSNNKKDDGGGISQGIISELASMALTGIIQLAIRTMLMGVTAVFVTRYRWTTYPALLYLAYVILQVVIKASVQRGSVYDTGITVFDAAAPALIMLGLIIMFVGRTDEGGWTWNFWMGEGLVLALFTFNSVQSIPWNALTLAALGVVSGLLTLWFRGKFYNYLAVIVIELVLAVLVAMAFPIIELLLEAILSEKLKKVGEKIRAHHQQLEEFYAEKYEREKESKVSQ